MVSELYLNKLVFEKRRIESRWGWTISEQLAGKTCLRRQPLVGITVIILQRSSVLPAVAGLRGKPRPAASIAWPALFARSEFCFVFPLVQALSC